MRKLLSILVAVLSPLCVFAQHEDLMEKAHGIPMDYVFQFYLEAKGIDANSSEEAIQEAVNYYKENEAAVLEWYDNYRHEQQVEGIAQARTSRAANWFNIVGSSVSGLVTGIANDNARQKAESAAAAEQARIARTEALERQKQASVGSSYSSTPQVSTPVPNQSSSSNVSVSDLYTNDQTWNKMVDNLVAQHGAAKAREIVLEMRAKDIESHQKTAALEESFRTSGKSDGSVPGSTVISAVTSSRTVVYLQISGGSVTHYATGGKNQLGEYNWRYVGKADIQDIKMTSYNASFGRDYSHAANVSGLGYVFFNY